MKNALLVYGFLLHTIASSPPHHLPPFNFVLHSCLSFPSSRIFCLLYLPPFFSISPPIHNHPPFFLPVIHFHPFNPPHPHPILVLVLILSLSSSSSYPRPRPHPPLLIFVFLRLSPQSPQASPTGDSTMKPEKDAIPPSSDDASKDAASADSDAAAATSSSSGNAVPPLSPLPDVEDDDDDLLLDEIDNIDDDTLLKVGYWGVAGLEWGRGVLKHP